MTLALGCIADDYTGASDLANTLTRAACARCRPSACRGRSEAARSRRGRGVAEKPLDRGQRLRWRARARPISGCAATARSMCCSRSARPSIRPTPAISALLWMRCAPTAGDRIVLVTPAFPETGRTVYQGNLFVGSVPLNESPLKDHPLNPMHDANLVRVLARQSKTKIGLVDLATRRARRGCDARAACAARRARHRRRHHRCGVRRDLEPSARSRSIIALGRRLRHRPRACARAGRLRAGHIANHRARAGCAGRRPRGLPGRQLLAGHARPDRQCRAVMPVLHLDPEHVVNGQDEARAPSVGRGIGSAEARS